MPVLQKSVTDMFPHCDVLNTYNPEEVIAIGAAKQVSDSVPITSNTYVHSV